MELALINTLTAIDEGCEIVDATITGMGRGAGNVKTELLLTALNAQSFLEVDFNPLSKVVDLFTDLQKKHEWGTNLPYMVSGAHSLPQKDVMDWVGKRYYSFNSIIRALQNQAKGLSDNVVLKTWEDTHQADNVLLVGGGASVKDHQETIIHYLNLNKSTTIIHASSKNALSFEDIENKQIFCLVGNEGHRMEEVFQGTIPVHSVCVLPPSPRKMGTYIPSLLINNCLELNQNTFSEKYIDSHCFIALQVALNLKAKQVFVVGFDGYSKAIMDDKAQELFAENSYLFNRFSEVTRLEPVSLVETSYPLKPCSIFATL